MRRVQRSQQGQSVDINDIIDVTQKSPSPLIPMIILVIVGIMLTIPNMMSYDEEYWTETMEQAQTQFMIGAFLLPVCLVLAVQACGLPQVNPVRNRVPSPLIDAVTQNMTTSILLLGVVIILLMLNSLRSTLHSPWQTPVYIERK